MAKISVSVGFTLKVAPDSYEFARYDLRVDEIDTDADVAAQLHGAAEAIRESADFIETRLHERLVESGLLKEVRAR